MGAVCRLETNEAALNMKTDLDMEFVDPLFQKMYGPCCFRVP